MGLDMHLSRQTYVGNFYVKEKDKHSITVHGPMADVIDVDKIVWLNEEVAYWRKANQIHHWFVENVQGGVDDCGQYRVEEDQLKRLLEDINTVLADPDRAEDLLPPSAGFFFGSLDIDDGYLEDLRNTQKVLQEILKKPLKPGQYYYYQASW